MDHKKFKLGTVTDITEIINRLNEGRGDKMFPVYRFNKSPDQPHFWVIEQENEDFVDCALVEIVGSDVYAISEDVYVMVREMFGKVL